MSYEFLMNFVIKCSNKVGKLSKINLKLLIQNPKLKIHNYKPLPFKIHNPKSKILIILLSTQLIHCPTVKYNNPTDGAGGLLMQLLDTLVTTFAGANTNAPELRVVLTGNPSAITEGQSATVQIKLSKAITSNLTVTLSLDNPIMTIDGAATKQMTFTSDNATVEQSFTLAALTDANSISETVNLKITADGLTDQSFSISTIDNTVEIVQTVIFTGLPTALSEGQSVAVKAKLAKAITSNVSVTITLSDPAITVDGGLSKTFTFTPSNATKDQAFILVAVSDSNTISETVSMIVSATDLADQTFTLTALEVEALKVVFTGMPAFITEGQSVTVQAKMSRAISSDLSVTITLTDPSLKIDGAISKTINFTTSNATTDQSITLSAISDTNTISETASIVVAATGLDTQILTITALDITTSAPVIAVSNAPTAITEGNTATGIGIKLSGNVTSDYTLTITSSNSSSITSNTSTLTFTSSNYTVDQQISLQALQDQNLIYEAVTFTLSGAGLNPVTFTVTAVEDDIQAISITGTTSLTEGGSGSISVSLTKEPSSNVTLILVSNDISSLTVATNSLTFTPTNYTTPQAIAINSLQDVNQTSETVTIAATSSGITTNNWSVLCIDDDTTPVFAGGSSVNEGGTLTLSINLSGNPGVTRTVSFSSSNTSSVTVSPASLTFTPSNYNTTQSLTITGVEEVNVLSETVTITASVTGLVTSTKTITTVDKDTMNITLAGATTVNEGSTATMTVALTKDPSGSLIVNLNSDTTNSVTVSPASLTFTTANYNTPQNVTLTGVEETSPANETSETVIITASASGVASQTRNITTIENDTTISFGNVVGYEGVSVTVPITLSGNPGESKTVSFSSNNNPPTFSPSTMTFTTSNYNTPQTLTLTGLTDANTTTVITASDSNQASSTKLVTNTWNATTAKYTIGGTISGLTGTVTLGNKSLETKNVSADGNFTFSALASTYSVFVKTYLIGKICTFANSVGTAVSNVTNINITCTNNSYTLGGSSLGLLSTGQTTVYATGDDGTNQKTIARGYTDNGDGTITDAVTGLIWQKCSRGQNNDTSCSGTATTADWTTAGTYCSGLSLASKNWRLPNVQEFLSIVDMGKASVATINSMVFPNTLSGYYWSSLIAPGGADALYIYFGNDLSFIAGIYPLGGGMTVRCVSGLTSGVKSFIDNADGTITDTATKLVWQKCSNGQDTTDCTGTATSQSWAEAVTYCNGLSLADKTWRLPNRNELRSIVDYPNHSQPAIDTTAFPNTQSNNYWSSSTYAFNISSAWAVGFSSYGSLSRQGKTSTYYVRCVSGP